MSTLIALKDNKTKKLYMGCESQTTAGNQKTYSNMSKMFRKKTHAGDIVIGISGRCSFHQIIQHDLDYNVAHSDNISYIRNLASQIREISEKLKLKSKEKGTVLIIFNNGIYTLEKDYYVADLNDFYAIGSGGRFALGAMSALTKTKRTNKLSPEEMIKISIESACDHDCYSSGDLEIETLKIK